ncbi:MAG: aconitate hydratase [Dehalococcoidia bacterium]|nr:aconitate hydratase [Dehalococcoidia bacterium]
MVQTDSTPQFVESCYSKMRANLSEVRKKHNKPLTLADKILFSHLDDPSTSDLKAGESYLLLRPDRVALQDVLGQTVMLNFMQTLKESVAVPTTVHCDHLIQARVEGGSDLLQSKQENEEVYDFLKNASAKFGVGFWGPGAGIIHQVVLENYAFPGALMIGTDSHTPNAGGLGACAVGVGGADAVEVMAGLPWELLAPKHIGVKLTGEMSGWTAPKDVIVYLAGALTVSGGTNSIIEYFGEGTKSISCTGKATITNMGAELGATTSVFPYDDRMSKYLKSTGRAELANLADSNQDLIRPDKETEEKPESFFDHVIEIDLSKLEPHIAGPHSPDRVRPISQLINEVNDQTNGFVEKIDTALIGSCTNSSYEDVSRVADVAQQASEHGLKSAASLMVTPGSEQVRSTIERDGQLATLQEIDSVTLANACGPCIGQWRREEVLDGVPNTIVTSYNRNFPRRNDGRSETMNFIASPEIVVALSIAGKLTFNPLTDTLTGVDGVDFKLLPPKPAPEVPPSDFIGGREFYIAPPENGSEIEISVNPESDRLQVLTPWEQWDGNDYEEIPLLVKTQGKTTTDHISPAGTWLRYRGHLEKFSENMFMGAINAFTGDAGTTMNQFTGESGISISKVAQDYKNKGSRWVVVGDYNYGEGSSREHAALSPRLLGGAAIIARGFARIHESNLKKQGILPLVFSDPKHYELVQETDRISLLDLDKLAAGETVRCILHHKDGTTDVLQLNHSLSSGQIGWIKAGSALNVLHQSN